MAITRAQQAKQLLANGGRTGFFLGGNFKGGYSKSREDSGASQNISSIGGDGGEITSDSGFRNDGVNNNVRDTGSDYGQFDRITERQRKQDLRDLALRQEEDKAFEQQGFETLRVKDNNFPGFIGMGLNALKGPRQKLLDRNIDFFRNDPRTARAREKYGLTAQGYRDYMSARLAGNIDAAGNIINQDDDDNSIIPFMAQAPSNTDQETEVEEEPFQRNFRLMADGGRAEFAEGGGIESRLEQLGGDVSSAEEMLQAINQRLQTAESGLGGGGGNQMPPGGFPVPGVLGAIPGIGGGNQMPLGGFPVPKIPGAIQQPGIGGLGTLATLAGSNQPSSTMNTPDYNTMFGGALKGLDMSGFKPVMTASQDVQQISINGNKISNNGAYIGSLYEYLNSTGQGDAISRYDGLTQLPSNKEGVATIQASGTLNGKPLFPEGTTFPSGGVNLAELYPNAGQMQIDPPDFMRPGNIPGTDSPYSSLRGAMPMGLGVPPSGNYADNFSQGEMKSPLQTALGLADGGRAALAEGGMPYEGGIMDLESGRQQYFLGKLVKKATRAVKKIAKSPIGKAALLYAGGSFLGALGAGSAGSGVGLKMFGPKAFASNLGMSLGKLGLGSKFIGPSQPKAFFGLGKAGAGILGSTALSYFMTPEEEEQQAMNYGADIDDPKTIMANPSLYTNRRLAAEGGSMDEPVAKKTMPLLDMDGQEMDLRAEGGFVPIGRMEKADDVPARLSKNEFVFTAEAVRNAGEGDVDKGAEVMYNMMKNLESGGEVSEKSQGLEGAREMFKTSQRLEEVI